MELLDLFKCAQKSRIGLGNKFIIDKNIPVESESESQDTAEPAPAAATVFCKEAGEVES